MKQTPNQTFELHLQGTDKEHLYRTWVSDKGQNPQTEHTFELRSDSVELTMALGKLARAAASGEKPEKDLHVEFGQRLYKLLFEGSLGNLWNERRKKAGRKPLALVLRIEPQTARFLLRLPWEYLHDGKDFLSTSWRTPVYRMPWGVEPVDFDPLEETLRMLVVISSPQI